ncbi:hypothetical protein AYR61_05690 [Secundilactobacillus paracollinoides]|uniref:NEAT domain-containing protein n=2 Tax=Secundilactobacillus paracollinoides TaxID=240427 RepID=A0A1B2J289_9LACO|nr:hypothetical protein AYR61_05690 [Secundilactobacillus paracollinoides]ANZ68403.1 hypothetical protein AYR63_06060 [Secundilactobacillus paracollinoides]
MTIAVLIGIQGQTAYAKSISYQALTYGTNKTSIASGYFVHPTSVTVKNHKYVVTMRIKTAKKLTSYPVKVLSVNGGKPQNVRKVKDSAGNSNLYYSFTTTNLKKRINAKLAIDVPKVYKANHMITFKFSTAGLPSLARQGSAAVTTKADTASTQPSKGQSSTASTQPSKGQSSTATKSQSASNREPNESSLSALKAKNESSSKAASASVAPKKDSSKASSSSSSASSSVGASSTPNQTAKAEDKKDQSQPKSKTPVLIVGIIVIIVVVGGGAFWFTGGRGRHSGGN